MKSILIIITCVAISAIFVKLFTYEFYLPDDPTVGVALRSTPSFVSRQIHNESDADPILFEDENVFLGRAIYRALAEWGWIALAGLWLGLLWIFLRQKARN